MWTRFGSVRLVGFMLRDLYYCIRSFETIRYRFSLFTMNKHVLPRVEWTSPSSGFRLPLPMSLQKSPSSNFLNRKQTRSQSRVLRLNVGNTQSPPTKICFRSLALWWSNNILWLLKCRSFLRLVLLKVSYERFPIWLLSGQRWKRCVAILIKPKKLIIYRPNIVFFFIYYVQ